LEVLIDHISLNGDLVLWYALEEKLAGDFIPYFGLFRVPGHWGL
jgi:hypothetical protein